MTDVSFGKYRLIAELGHGGMADVFLAVQAGPAGSGFRKLTVIKRLRQNLVDEPEFVAMLVDEARIAAGLNHPNVVQTNEVGREGNHYFIAMEYLDGQPLHRIQNRAVQREKDEGASPFLKEQQYVVTMDVLAGLHHAHELTDYDGTPLQIVHRDITPHNIFVTYEGQVKVVDFGIAKAVGRASETRQGVIKGKVRYMAPEQALGLPVDRRADLFSVGVMLWEAATGRRLWKGVEDLEIVGALVAGKPLPLARDVDPTIPEGLAKVLDRALTLKREDRYPTAEEFRADLEQYLASAGLLVEGRRGLARTVCELFKDKRLEIKNVIEKQIADLDQWPSVKPILMPTSDSSGTPISTPVSLSVGESTRGVAAALASVGNTKLSAGTSNPPASTSTQPHAAAMQRRGSALPLVLGLVAALVVGGSIAMWKKAKPTVATHDPTSAPSSKPADPTEQKVTVLDVKVTPPTAQLFIDGALLPPNPMEARFVRDGLSHQLRGEAPGFKERTIAVQYDEGEKHITLTLEPVEGPAPVAVNAHAHGSSSSGGLRISAKTSAAPTHETTPPPPTAATAAPPPTTASPTAAPPPTTAAPTAAPAPTVAPGTVDQRGVTRTVRGHQSEVQACYDRARMDKADLKGKIAVSASVNAQGQVLSASANNGTGSTRLEQCLLGAFRGWTFPEPAGGVNGNVTFTFNFD